MTDAHRANGDELLRAENLHRSFHDGVRELQVLRGAELAVRRGEAVAVIGMSGSGKSTLLHLLGGLDRPDAGRIVVEGRPMTELRADELDTMRNTRIGYVFQFHHLLPEFTALENAMMPALMARRTPANARREATEMLSRLGLGERLGHQPSRLSGGEQQRVALARALANRPSLLLADEPTGNLDKATGEQVIELIWSQTVRENRGLVIVTHEPVIATRADRVLLLSDGRLNDVTRDELERWSTHPGA